MTARICPTCGRKFAAGAGWMMPFCSDRCQTIDLGRWFGEKYHVPSIRRLMDDSTEDAESSGDGDEHESSRGF